MLSSHRNPPARKGDIDFLLLQALLPFLFLDARKSFFNLDSRSSLISLARLAHLSALSLGKRSQSLKKLRQTSLSSQDPDSNVIHFSLPRRLGIEEGNVSLYNVSNSSFTKAISLQEVLQSSTSESNRSSWPSQQSSKKRWVTNSQIGQDLPVQFHMGFLQGIHQTAVGNPMEPRRRIDPGDPQSPKISLSYLAVPIGISKSSVDSIHCRPIEPAPPSHIAFGHL